MGRFPSPKNFLKTYTKNLTNPLATLIRSAPIVERRLVFWDGVVGKVGNSVPSSDFYSQIKLYF